MAADGSFSVDPTALLAGSKSLMAASDSANAAGGYMSCHRAGEFGDSGVDDAVAALIGRATRGMDDIGQWLSILSSNVALAAVGYVATDKGVIPGDLAGAYRHA